jgi:hypothetical protein
LIQRTAALMKYVDGEMPKYFGRLPRLLNVLRQLG